MKKINIGLIGCGTVGTGVAKLLLENREIISARAGIPVCLKYVADIDIERDRGIQFEDGVLINDAAPVIEDPDVDIIVEMIGGKGIAKDIILDAMDRGKSIVTANKALLASNGNMLFKKASEKKVDLAYEASVGGCIPIIKTIKESLVGNHITSMIGILNGTCNYILSKITQENIPFKEALTQAQTKGFAEADPTLDVEGFDTAHKLAILNTLAYGIKINLSDIYIEGISNISVMDIKLAHQFGYAIKLLAVSKDRGDAIEARVHPTMVPHANLMSNVNGSLNAITVSGDAVEDILLYGRGAGMMPTASAVVSDIVDIARNRITGNTGRIPPSSYQTESIKKTPIMPIDQITTHYYLRFSALDQPGVLSKVAGILGNNNISIKLVDQKGRKLEGGVPIVMLTHRAKEADMRRALNEISQLDQIIDPPIIIRIEDENIAND